MCSFANQFRGVRLATISSDLFGQPQSPLLLGAHHFPHAGSHLVKGNGHGSQLIMANDRRSVMQGPPSIHRRAAWGHPANRQATCGWPATAR